MTADIFLWLTAALPIVFVLLLFGAFLYGYFRPERALASSTVPRPQFGPDIDSSEVAVLIASRNGAGSIKSAVLAARRNNCYVYVASDASTDDTAHVARAAGARVLALTDNVGKPAALLRAYEHFQLGGRYRAILILDDDVLVEDDFVEAALDVMVADDAAIVVGKNLTLWPRKHRWNIWLAKRAFSYWNYQLIIRRLQSSFGVMNCISGSNSMYRTKLLDELLPVPPPYIVDDTFWVLETQRRNLGAIVYAPKARAHLQDPTNFRDWYKQNLRWLWGTFQGIIGHHVGRRKTRFDFAYIILMIQWVVYIAGTPVTLWFFVVTARGSPNSALIFVGLYCAWMVAAAVALDHTQLLVLAPVIIIVDLLYRVIFVHALVKAVRNPTVESCTWASPTRFNPNVT